MQVEPYDAEEPRQETLQLSSEERAALIAEVVAHQAATLTCPACGLRNPPGQRVCLRCESGVIARQVTVKLGLGQAPPKEKTRTVGDVLIPTEKSITLEIGSTALQLPVVAILTLGRDATPRDDKTPHVDLTLYGAWESGVSRNHAEIRRRNKLLYIVDLGSTNGSTLNGRRLYPGAEKLLRSGDKVQFSRMTLTVKF